ncbi:MAG: hypothetical protein LBQ00_08055 [Syntrophobacterales bacterium]|jgi:hypothetical protein|nr:hypothetical protein [Syntrophobacterales bacterium]
MEIYCTQLGMVTDFSYCLSANGEAPCRSMIGCWRERVDIVKLLRRVFTEEELRECFGGLPKTRIERIIESLKSVHNADP